VVRLAILQGDALHADPLAVLEVNSLQMKDTAVSCSLLCERRISSPWERAELAHLGSGLRAHKRRLRPPLLPSAVDDAPAGDLEVLNLVEVEPLAALAMPPVAGALRRNDVPGNLSNRKSRTEEPVRVSRETIADGG
jgi:hypothetical protein